MKTLIAFFLLLAIFSCSKEKYTPPAFSEAAYKVTIKMNWAAPQFGVAAGAHFTPFNGMIHSGDTSLWLPGGLATKGLEDVAEIGDNNFMTMETNEIVKKNRALSQFILPAPGITGTINADLVLNTDFPQVSLASMIAPSPDWFTGIHNLNLFRDNKWADDVIVEMFSYDAGTEEGNVFGYDNPSTDPHQNIQLLTPGSASVLANGNAGLPPIGTIHFSRK